MSGPYGGLDAIRQDDALLDALAQRRTADSADDPAAGLLAALVEDVHSAAAREPELEPAGGPSKRTRGRRLPRTIVALGVTTAVLASTGVGAAAGGLEGALVGNDVRDEVFHPRALAALAAPPSTDRREEAALDRSAGPQPHRGKIRTAAPEQEIGEPPPQSARLDPARGFLLSWVRR